jgi:multidrug efflux pump
MEGQQSDFRSPSSIDNIYVRSGRSGELIPLDNLVSFEEQATSSRLNRYNRMRAITISANLADGYTVGEAITFLQQVMEEQLPERASFDLKGESQLYQESGNSILFIFVLALLITYLVLCAQFENWIQPFVILLTVPLALLGALIGLYLTRLTFNIYSQIGLVMLIGLAAKNGILIVEFTNQLRDKGIAFEEAIRQAASQRLRPIVMTGVTTICSALPLVLAIGPGAESRSVIGIVIFAGVLMAVFMTLYIVPVAYYWLARGTQSPLTLSRKLQDMEQQLPEMKKPT